VARRRKTFIDSSALTAIVPMLALLPAWLTAMSLIWVVVAIPFDTSYLTFIGTAAAHLRDAHAGCPHTRT
jgi:hypothetical protein